MISYQWSDFWKSKCCKSNTDWSFYQVCILYFLRLTIIISLDMSKVTRWSINWKGGRDTNASPIFWSNISMLMSLQVDCLLEIFQERLMYQISCSVGLYGWTITIFMMCACLLAAIKRVGLGASLVKLLSKASRKRSLSILKSTMFQIGIEVVYYTVLTIIFCMRLIIADRLTLLLAPFFSNMQYSFLNGIE